MRGVERRERERGRPRLRNIQTREDIGTLVPGGFFHRCRISSLGIGACYHSGLKDISFISPGLWHESVPILDPWHRVVPRPGAKCFPGHLFKSKVSAAVAPGTDALISTGCNHRWYFWSGPMACFLVVPLRALLAYT